MFTRCKLYIALVFSAVAATPMHAEAACDSLSFDNADAQDIIIGEAGYRQCFTGPNGYECIFMPYSGRKLGVCWRGPDGIWHMEILACGSSTPSSELFAIGSGGGNDWVGVLLPGHTLGDLTLLPAGGGYGAMHCEGSDYLAPWNPNWDFGISAALGTGADIFHGSPNADTAYTNDIAFIQVPGSFPPVWQITSPADQSNDRLCGWGGNDRLYGDADDQFPGGNEDSLHGGDGAGDFCDGDAYRDGNDAYDLWKECETHADAFAANAFWNIECRGDDDPIHDLQ